MIQQRNVLTKSVGSSRDVIVPAPLSSGPDESPRASHVLMPHLLVAFTVLSAVLLVVLAEFVRLLPHASFYPIPGVYRGFSEFDISHILRTAHEIRPTDKYSVSTYSSGIYLGTDDILRHKIEASVMLLLGLGSGDLESYYHFGQWPVLIVFPLAVLALFGALARANGAKLDRVSSLSLLAFCLLGSFPMVDVTYHGETNTATGWTFMCMALYGLVRIRENPIGGRLLFFTFSALVVLLYHTSALVLASAVVSVGVFELLRRRGSTRHSHSAVTMLVVALLVTCYFMYVSVSFFQLFSKSLSKVPSLALYLLRQQAGDPPRDFALRDLLTPHLGLSFVLPLFALTVLVLAPVVVVVWLGVRRRLATVGGNVTYDVVYPWLLGLAPFGVALFVWSGFLGVQDKEGEFGSVFCIFALIALFVRRLGRRARKFLILLIAICVVLSSYLYVLYEEHGASNLTYAEQEAATWVAQRATPNESVFTDLRLASPLIAAGHLAVEGVDDYEPPLMVRKELLSIYYNTGNARSVLSGLRLIHLAPRSQLRYAMFSSRQADNLPGVKGYDYNFKGASPGFMTRLDRVPGFNLVYSNGTVNIYEISPPKETHAH